MADVESVGAPYAPPPRGSTPSVGRPLVADLLALRELQTSLGLEETADAVVRVCANAIVEILAIDCGLALLDADAPHPALQFGWCQGRAMPSSEAEVVMRALEREIAEVRTGRAGSLLFGAAGGPQTPGSTPAALRALGYGAVLILGLGSSGRRTGALVLLAREPDAFSGEPMILAEILASEMSDRVERVRLRSRGGFAASASGGEADLEARRLRARNAELEAQAAIAAAAAPALDSDRQVEMALRAAIERSGHAAGAIYLVETSDAGDDVLRFARGFGEPAWLEMARLPRWRKGEGLPGRVWETGQGVAFGEIAADPGGFGLEALRRSGYRRVCCEPLKGRGRIIGILELFGAEARPYEEMEKGLVRAIADQVGTTIHNARLLADVMRSSLDLEWQVGRLGTERARIEQGRRAFADLLAAASAEHEIELRSAAILERLLSMTGADAAALLTIAPGASSLKLVAQRGFPDEAANALYLRPTDDAILALGMREGGGAIVDLADEVVLAAGWPRLAGYRHAVVEPCRTGGELRGVLLLATRYAGTLGEEMRTLLGPVAGLAALVLEGAQNAASGTRAVPRDPAEAPERNEAAPADPRAGVAPAPAPRPDLLARAQKMEALGRLTPGVVHTLNNSMAAIMGHASHIRILVPDHNPVHGKAAVIVEQSQRAADLVRAVLSFSGGRTGQREAVDLSPLIAETLELLARSLDPSIVVEARCAPSLPPVLADPGEMRQVLLNLAVNAKDALPDGGRIVFESRSGHLDERVVGTIPGLRPGDYVSIVVSDNGGGMSTEVLERAFEPFFTTKPIAQGSGLGLTVVQDIVRQHGGHVALSSAPGVGTAVRLYLPVAARAAAGAGAAEGPRREMISTAPFPALREDGTLADAPERSDDADDDPGDADPPAPVDDGSPPPWLQTRPFGDRGKATRILVVDDEAVLRDMTAEMLRSRGYEVLLACDGVEALEIYRREWGTIALVVLDLIMPRLGGLETFRRLTGMDRKVRVLLCSGQTGGTQAQQATLEGAVGLLPKPFGMAELLGWVERGLKN